jgi:hypothetical protein
MIRVAHVFDIIDCTIYSSIYRIHQIAHRQKRILVLHKSFWHPFLSIKIGFFALSQRVSSRHERALHLVQRVRKSCARFSNVIARLFAVFQSRYALRGELLANRGYPRPVMKVVFCCFGAKKSSDTW